MGVIPLPAMHQQHEGEYVLKGPCCIAYESDDLHWVAQYLVATLNSTLRLDATAELCSTASGFPISLALGASLEQLTDSRHLEEGYKLDVESTSGVSIQGVTSRGVFYGVQTLLQLLPCARNSPEQCEFNISCTQILDAPRFRWRGVLLDVGRHFYSVSYIKRVLDLMAMHKMNIFHWHLTEDQGWRLEVKALPRLTEFGAWRRHGDGKYGGFYTQDEVREVVAYAARRGIDVMPEVELPGHCCAALASYPELSCTGLVTEVPNQWGIHEDVYCAGKEAVFDFLDKVFTEVAQLFPFEYVHIGGDECPKVRWEMCTSCQQRISKEKLEGESQLQSWFIQRAGKMLAQHKKKIVGWDEILEGGLPDGATVMSWRGMAGGIIAAKQGQDVIMTPTSHCYFDYKQSNSPDEPGAWYACLPLHMAYLFDPIPTPFQPVPPMLANLSTLSPTLLPPPAIRLTPSQEADTASPALDPMDTDEAGPAQPRPEGEQQAAPSPSPAPPSEPAATQPPHEAGEQLPDVSEMSATVLHEETVPSPPNTPVTPLPPPELGSGVAGSAEQGQATSSQAQGEGSSNKDESTGREAQPAAEAAGSSGTAATGQPPNLPQLLLPALQASFPACPGPLRSPTKLSDCQLTLEEQSHILGGQANLWTEYVGDEHTAEYMLLPRLCGLSEALWSPRQSRDWNGFLERLKLHVQRLESLGYRYRPLGFA